MRILVEDTLLIDLENYEMSNTHEDSEPKRINKKPHDVLAYLWENRDHVLSIDQIFSYVWNNSVDIAEPKQCVRDAIRKIRKLISNLVSEKLANDFIKNEIDIGYKIDTHIVHCDVLLDDSNTESVSGTVDPDDEGSTHTNTKASITQNFANFGSGPQIANNFGAIVIGKGNPNV